MIVLSVGVVIMSLVGAAGWIGGLRVNLTPSEPLGFWQIMPLDGPVVVGEVVFVCPPGTAGMRNALERGYLRRGLCPGGFAPLIKTVVAVAGDVVDLGQSVSIDGKMISGSRIMKKDGMGRDLSAYAGGVVPPGKVFLYSAFPGSFDSRYFGPLPVSSILGLAREVWTFVP